MSSLSRHVCSQISCCCTCLSCQTALRSNTFVPPKSLCLVPLRRSRRTPSSLSSLRPVGFARWLGKWGSLMFQLRGVARRTRKSSSYDGDCPPPPAKRLRWAPVLCFSFVAIAQPCHVCPDVGSLVHKRLRMLPLVSCQKRPPVSPPSPVPGSFKRRRWSESAIMPHVVPYSDLSAFDGKSV